MICPNCKVEYREGFKECSDCHVDLVSNPQKPVISHQGHDLTIKFGIVLLFLTIMELIATTISYEFLYTYRQSHGGVNGTTPISIMHPLIWFLISIELFISVVVICHGIYAYYKNS